MEAKKVLKEEFYKKIGILDVTLDVQGNYPYKTVFRLRYGEVIGFAYGGTYYLYE